MDFDEWYHGIVEEADLTDKRYPVKGMNVWRPYGWSVMRALDDLVRAEMVRTGHEEVQFPLLIPSTEFAKEAEHIKGFDSEVYWVTRGGVNELDVPMLLRPTSETAMYPMFALWVRSHTDLPLKTFQIVNVFRYETKMTRAFMRVREVHFFEAHTCHADEADAERQIAEDLGIARRYYGAISLPYVLTRRPEWDKFPGAHYSLGADAFMPSGKTLQVGTFHQYRDNFAAAYGIRYEAEGGEHRNVHQTTYGMSERVLGALVGIHGDERGIVLPPAVAPVQVVIVPVFKRGGPDIVGPCREIVSSLAAAGIRARVDDRDLRPGNKYYHWEKRGVPLRLEIGQRELGSGEASLALRDMPVGEGKRTVRMEGLAAALKAELDSFSARLMARAASALEAGIHAFDDLRQARPEGIVRLGWCGEEECGRAMEDHLDMTMLGTWLDDTMRPREERRCAVCGGGGSAVLLARTY